MPQLRPRYRSAQLGSKSCRPEIQSMPLLVHKRLYAYMDRQILDLATAGWLTSFQSSVVNHEATTMLNTVA